MTDRDEKGELAGAAEQGSGECVVARSVGDRHLGLEGEVDHLNQLQPTRETVRRC